MTPKPSTPHADQILGPYWESSITPESLSNWSLQLGKAGAELGFIAGDGQVQAVQLLGYGQGALAEAISSAWAKYFVYVGKCAAQFGEASACVAAWAESLGAMLGAMAGVVDWAEAAIAAFEAARVELELVGQNVDELIQTVITEAHTQVTGISGAAIAGLAALPGWVTAIGGPPTGLPHGATAPGNPTGMSSGGAPPGAPAVPQGGLAGGNPAGMSSGGVPPGAAAIPQGAPATSNPAGMSVGGAPALGGPGLPEGAPLLPNPTAMSPGGVPTNAAAMPGAPSGVLGTGMAPATGSSAGLPAAGLSPASGAPVSSVPGAGATPVGAPGAPALGSPVTGAPAVAGAPATAGSPLPSVSPSGGLAGIETQAGIVAPTGTVTGLAAPAAGLGPAAAAAATPLAGAPMSAAPLAGTTAAAAVAPTSSPIAAVPPLTPVAPTAPAVAPPPMAAAAPAQSVMHMPASASSGAPAAVPATPGPHSPSGQHSSTSSSVSPGSHETHGAADEEGAAGPVPHLAPVDDAAIVPVPLIFRGAEDPQRQVVDMDLAMVRTVLETAGGGSTVRWAAGMVVTGGRRQVVVTTDRGRSWFPPNVLLPENAVLPWKHEDSARWEGLLDPARVIVEYAAAAASGTLTALASTHSSAPGVAAGVPFAFADAVQRPRPDLLGVPTAGRETFAVSAARLVAADAITDPHDQRRQALWIAHDAVEKADDASSVRRSILAALNADPNLLEPKKIDRLGWVALTNENEVLWERDFAARIDVRNVDIGRLDTGGGASRPFLVQSYATETVLALRNASPRQALLDALYSWSMLLELIDTEGRRYPREPANAF